MPIQAKPEEWLLIQKQQIANETLILGAGRYVDRLVASEFVNCTFDIVSPPATMISRCRLINCVFRPRKGKKIMDRPIGDNYWENCAFHGHYEGSNFGNSSDDIDGPSDWPEVAIRQCDFSHATMAGCHFRRLEIESTKFPLWPCFTVLRPKMNRQAWVTAGAQFKQGVFESLLSGDYEDAVTHHWPSIVKWYKLSSPPDAEAVKAILQKLDFVRL